MSSSANPRSAANNDRRTSATVSAKPRVPSSRIEPKGRPGPAGEVQPDDSASNAPHRRKFSVPEKSHGSTRTTNERQTERVSVRTRENVQIRIRSPMKASTSDDKGSWQSEIRKSPRIGSPISQSVPLPKKIEKEKEPPRRLRS